MADEEKKNEESPEETPEETPAEEAKAEETPAEEAKAEETPAEEPKAEEAPAEDADSGDDSGDEGGDEAPADAPAAAGDDDELDWKAKKRLERSRQPHEPGPPVDPEKRAAERQARRKAARAERSRYRKRARGKREKGTPTPPADRETVPAKMRQGTVVSSKADKTITVRIDVVRRHPTYEKIVRRSGTLHAHDEQNEAGEGDLVKIVETRPLSKTKRWRLSEIVEKAK